MLASAEVVVTSELTSAEVGRVLQRLVATGRMTAAEGDRAWASYAAAWGHWQVYGLDESVLQRVREPFPREPVRTLDAVHLATAAAYALAVTRPVVLSTDGQIRANAEALGLSVAP